VSPRVTIVHERFTEVGGSELVVRELARLFPGSQVVAPLVHSAGVPDGLQEHIRGHVPLRRLYRGGGTYAHLLPLLPMAMRSLDLSDTDLVITSHHAFAHRVRPPAGTPVLSYTHTPARWLWEPSMRAGEAGGALGGALLSAFAATQTRPDRAAAQRVDHLLVNSTTVQDRVRRWWGLQSTVVHPPVDTEFFSPGSEVPREDFLLLAGRLVPYKRPEVAVDVAAALDLPLVVAGDGRSRPGLEARAGRRTTFLGRVTDDELRDLYRRCRALLFPGEEDFGMVPVEAQACGAPVIALDRGGACDSVLHSVSGLLYPMDARGGRDGLAAVLARLDDVCFDAGRVRSNAERFGRHVFRDKVVEAAAALLSERSGRL
jgi:glycosyltransferase involved in cell wall biosynthesis